MTTILKTNTSSLIIHNLEENIEKLLEECVSIIDYELNINPEITIFGKKCKQHRSVGFYSDILRGYNYSTSKTPAKKMHPCLRKLLIYVNDKFNHDFNGILINKYLNGLDYIGKHSDDERNLDKTVGVVALSYGATRKFRIRNKFTNKIIIDLPSEKNKIIQMIGDFQNEFTHEIPIEKNIKDVRYSFTFRKHIN